MVFLTADGAAVNMGQLSTWGSCQHGTAVNMGQLSTWDICQHGAAVNMGQLSTWGSCQHGTAVNMGPLSTWGHCQHGAEEWCGYEVEVSCRIVVHGITHRLELGVSKAIKDHLRLNDVFSFLFELLPKRR